MAGGLKSQNFRRVPSGSADLPKIGGEVARSLCHGGTIRGFQLIAIGGLWYRDQVSDTRRTRNEQLGPEQRTPLLVRRRTGNQHSSGMVDRRHRAVWLSVHPNGDQNGLDIRSADERRAVARYRRACAGRPRT